MSKNELIVLAKQKAKEHGIDPSLVCAVAEHESCGWKPWAIRYEPAFFERYVQRQKGINATEAYGLAFSYGLMQIMGLTARELGFKGEFLTELLDPATALEFGCRKLKHCLDLCSGQVVPALLRYNGGADSSYPSKVMTLQGKY